MRRVIKVESEWVLRLIGYCVGTLAASYEGDRDKVLGTPHLVMTMDDGSSRGRTIGTVSLN